MSLVKKYWPQVHSLLFFALWYVVVISVSKPGGDSTALIFEGVFLILCFSVRYASYGLANFKKELLFSLTITIVGSCVDATIAQAGFILFPYTSITIASYPVWLIGIWCAFSTALFTSLEWLTNRTLLQVLFGGIGGSLSILAASKFGAVAFPYEINSTLALIAVEWMFLLPFSFWVKKLIKR